MFFFTQKLSLNNLKKNPTQQTKPNQKKPIAKNRDSCVSVRNFVYACLDNQTSSHGLICGKAFPKSLE